MIRTEALIFMGITMLFTTLGPIIAAILFYKKQKYYVGSVFIGAAVFFLFQVVTRIPLIQIVLPNMQWYQDMAQNNLWGYALFLGFTAGLFEEVGRYLAFILVLKKHLNWKNAVAFGIGHGGIEAILLVGLSYVSNLITSVMINSGLYDTMIAQYPEQAREALIQAKTILLQTPSHMYLVSGAERLFTFFIHIALSVLVMVGIQKKKGLLYLGLAIILHMLIDSPAVIMMSSGVSIWVIEGFIFILAIISFLYVRKKGHEENLSAAPMGEA
ncbi:MAG: YhfC family intramembrane metalloprotease [Thermoclostridium sp.]|nr:YhfC family intramembrane metalloprotease [Thermoclostridium sp.]